MRALHGRVSGIVSQKDEGILKPLSLRKNCHFSIGASNDKF